MDNVRASPSSTSTNVSFAYVRRIDQSTYQSKAVKLIFATQITVKQTAASLSHQSKRNERQTIHSARSGGSERSELFTDLLWAAKNRKKEDDKVNVGWYGIAKHSSGLLTIQTLALNDPSQPKPHSVSEEKDMGFYDYPPPSPPFWREDRGLVTIAMELRLEETSDAWTPFDPAGAYEADGDTQSSLQYDFVIPPTLIKREETPDSSG